jgi:hypothetical protein
MILSAKTEIYFHVGTGKTGTTFLQYRAFPKFQGVRYIQRTQYRKAAEIIKKEGAGKYFLSWEMDQQMEEEVKKWAILFPHTHAIIVFRKHDSYLASQYRRFVKNGFRGDLRAFLDIEKDTGLFKISDFTYMRQVKILEEAFGRKPTVLFYDDMVKNPAGFVSKIAGLMGATVDTSIVNFNKKHTSYSEKQLKAMMAAGRFINMRKRRLFKNGALHLIWKIGFGALRYSILYGSRVLPAACFSSRPLMNSDELQSVALYFQKDWEEVVEYAR